MQKLLELIAFLEGAPDAQGLRFLGKVTISMISSNIIGKQSKSSKTGMTEKLRLIVLPLAAPQTHEGFPGGALENHWEIIGNPNDSASLHERCWLR